MLEILTQPSTPLSPAQRAIRLVARQVMTGLCLLFALGLMGATAERLASPDAGDPLSTPRITFVRTPAPLPPLRAIWPADLTPAAAEPVELLRDATLPAAIPTPAANRIPRPRLVWMEVTAYCPCTKCCGPNAQGITASGKTVDYNQGLFVAADPSLPFGTRLIIPGYADNRPVEVIDRGGAIKGNKLDVYFPDHDTARQWGRQRLAVILLAD